MNFGTKRSALFARLLVHVPEVEDKYGVEPVEMDNGTGRNGSSPHVFLIMKNDTIYKNTLNFNNTPHKGCRT